MVNQETPWRRREPDHPVGPLFVDRWSPRAMAGEPLPSTDLHSLFEAARWAPSSRNAQPWRFCYAGRESDAWDAFLLLLHEHNQEWAKDAGALVVVCSKTTFDDGAPSRTHSYDTGAAWENFALEGSRRGLVVHGIGGFDRERARDVVDLPEQHAVEAMAAVGVPADPDAVTEDSRREPTDRRPVSAFAFEGGFP